MRPCLLVRAFRANIARGLRGFAAAWATLGALPLTPHQEPEVPGPPTLALCLRYTAKECAPIVSRTSRDQIHALTAVAGL